VHLSTPAEFLSIGRTSTSAHFGVGIYWSASTLVLGQLADFRLMYHRLIVLSTTLELDMANPKELQEAAEAIQNVRRLPAVQRHQQSEDLLRQAEEWARKEYCKVSEKKPDRNDAGANGRNSTQASLRLPKLRTRPHRIHCP
jgi:hypothetical protein